MALDLLVVSTMWPSPKAPQFGVFVERQVEELRRQGAEVHVEAMRRASGGVGKLAGYGRLGLDVRSYARRHRPNAVIGHFLVPGGTFAVRAGAASASPVVVFAHGQDVTNAERSVTIRGRTQSVIDQASAVVAVSDQLAARLSAVCPSATPTHVFDMGVDTRIFRPGDRDIAAATFGPPPSRPLIVQIGNLIERKNPERLADAFALVRERHGGGELWIVGDGPLADRLGGRPGVRLLGAVTQPEVARILRAADVGALVSLREGYGLGAIEAVACGLPVVVSASIPVAAALPASAAVPVDPTSVEDIARGIGEALALTRSDPGGLAAAEARSVRASTRRLLDIVTAIAASRL